MRVEDAHPAIVSKRQIRMANRLLGSRAPKKINPRRASSPYLLSGLLRCETCGKAMTAADAKSGKYTYYVCHSLLKRGNGACETPRLNAKSFENLIGDEIRANVLTESNIRDLVKLLDEEVDGVAHEQRERLQTIEEEPEDVKRRLGRIWQVIETTDIEMADASDRIREHRERKEKLEIAAEEARKLLSDRRQFQRDTFVYRRLPDTLTDDGYYPTYRNPQSACIFQRKPYQCPARKQQEDLHHEPEHPPHPHVSPPLSARGVAGGSSCPSARGRGLRPRACLTG